jgi:antitoxin component of RelBE/YafQ-DinJ toxin-antitoxin module
MCDNTKELMEDHDLDEDTAERVQDIMDEYGLDEDDAIMIEEET